MFRLNSLAWRSVLEAGPYLTNPKTNSAPVSFDRLKPTAITTGTGFLKKLNDANAPLVVNLAGALSLQKKNLTAPLMPPAWCILLEILLQIYPSL